MTPETLLAQAAEADSAADAIFAAMDAARGDSTVLRVAGFEHELERASDLRRRARSLRADASQFGQAKAPLPVAAAPAAPRPAPAKPVAPALSPSTAVRVPSIAPTAVETAETIAQRIFQSDRVGLGTDAVDVVAARILASDGPDGIPADKDVPRGNKRIPKGDDPADVEDVARRILNS